MKALITGASSGIGMEFARILSKNGYELILVARRKDRLLKLVNELDTPCKIIDMDLSNEKNCYLLFEQVKNEGIDILINNAGFGVHGEFTETSLEKEVDMIKVNIIALHILTKLFARKFKKQNYGYILNVASSASFMPGPLMASYYASKAYVLRLSLAIRKELKKSKSKVKISVLCPGPVDTEFNEVAGVQFGVKSITPQYVAEYTIREMLKGKDIIIPTFSMKAATFFSRFMPRSLVMEITYNIQKKKYK